MTAAVATRTGVLILGNLHGTVPVPFLWCRFDPEERGLDGAVRRLGRAGLDPRPGGAFERAIVGHARRPPWTAGSALGLEGVAESARGVVQARSGRPRGDLQHLGDLHERQPEVVVQDEDRPLVDREPAERPLQFVAVGDGVASIRGRWPVDGQDADVGDPMACPLRFVVAGVDEDPMDPGLEAVRLPQCGIRRQARTRAFCSASSASPESRRIRWATA